MISTTIIAKNAASLLPKCIGSAKHLTDDIVVIIDPTTTDDTAVVAEKLGARVFFRVLDNFAAQKNFAAEKAKYDWIFSLDADEETPPALVNEIKTTLTNTDKHGFLIPRLNYIFSKPIYHSNWGPADDTHVWLYHRRHAQWTGEIHEEVKVNGPIGKLANYKIHHNYATVEEFINKLNFYTSLEAKHPRLYSNPVYDFLRRYIWHLGFLDGWHGLFLAYLMFIYHTVVWVKIWANKRV